MKNKLILHIGMWKTGTTSIQENLSKNKELLQCIGVEYPSEINNHIFLLPDVYENYINHVAIKSYKPGVEKLNDIKNSFFDSVFKGNEGTTYILSSEFFLDLNVNEVNKLKDILSGYFSEIKILCYMRPPESHFKSAVNEQVKQGHYPIEKAYEKHIEINEYRRIYIWRDAFGKGSVIVRPFDNKQWKNQNLLDDFFDSINIKKPDSFIETKIKNESLSQAGIEIADSIAKIAPSFSKQRPNTDFLYRIKGSCFDIPYGIKNKCIKRNSSLISDINKDFGIDINKALAKRTKVEPDIKNIETRDSIAKLLLEFSNRNKMLSSELTFYKAKCHYLNKEFIRAKELFEDILYLDEFEIYRDYICLLYDMKLYDDLRPFLKKALDIKPDAPWLNEIKVRLK